MKLHFQFRIYYSFIIVHCSLFSIYGQEANQDKKEKYNEVVKVVSDYTPSISDAYKININPKIEDTIVETPDIRYSIFSKRINTSFEASPIKPAKIQNEPLSLLYHSYLKAGFGTQLTPYLEYFYNSLRSKNYSTGFRFKHLSSNSINSIKNYKNPIFSNNEIDLYGKYFENNNTIYANVFLKRNVFHFYGNSPYFEENYNLIKPSDKHIFFLAGLSTMIENNNSDAKKFNYKLGFKYYNLSDNISAYENSINVKGVLTKAIDLLKLSEKQSFDVFTDFNFYNNHCTGFNTNNAILKVAPTLSGKYDRFKILVGTNVFFRFDDKTTLKYYPLASIDFTLAENFLYLYGKIDGEIYKNSYFNLTEKNPYIYPDFPTTFSYNRFNATGGLKGIISKDIIYFISLNAIKVDRLPFYINDTLGTSNGLKDNTDKFSVLYDNATIFDFKGEISIKQNEKLSFLIKSNYYIYKLKTEKYPWNTPTFDASLTSFYNLNDKLQLKADLIYLNWMWAKKYKADKTIENIKVNKNGALDVNIGAEYKYNNRASAFVNLNNILNTRYEIFNGYPAYRFNAMLGLTYKF